MGYLWDTYGIPMGYLWDTYGIPALHSYYCKSIWIFIHFQYIYIKNTGEVIRTPDLGVISPARSRCATPGNLKFRFFLVQHNVFLETAFKRSSSQLHRLWFVLRPAWRPVSLKLANSNTGEVIRTPDLGVMNPAR